MSKIDANDFSRNHGSQALYEELGKMADNAEPVINNGTAQKDQQSSVHDKSIPLSYLLKNPELLNPLPRILTTFMALDLALSGGLCLGAMYVLAALTGRGKSTFCANLARRLALSNCEVLWLTLEDSDISSARKIVSQQSIVPMLALENYKKPGAVTMAEAQRVQSAIGELSEIPIRIDSATCNIDDVEKMVTFRVSQGTKVVLVDQSSWLHVPESEGQYQEASEIARRLKLLAKNLKIVVIVLVQVNRTGAAAVRDGQELQLFHIRDSGKWEEDSDAVLIIQSIDDTQNGDGLMKIDLKKLRGGKNNQRIILKTKLSCGLVEDSPEHLAPEDLNKPVGADDKTDVAWTVVRFVSDCCTDRPEPKVIILGRAEDTGLSQRKADKLFQRALAETRIYPWKLNNNYFEYSTNRPPEEVIEFKQVKRSVGRPKKIITDTAHTPPIPPTVP